MWLLYRMASAILVWHLESVVIPQLNLSHYQFSQEVIWEEKKGVFSQVGLQNAFLFLHYEYAVFCHTCLMGFKLKRMKTSMRADPAFVSSIAS